MGKLDNIKVVNTRPLGQEANLTRLLQQEGAHVFHLPCLKIEYVPVPSSELALKTALGNDQIIVFTSTNGIRGLLASDISATLLRSIQQKPVVAIGEGTKREAELHGFRVAEVAEQANVNSLIGTIKRYFPTGQLLFVRGESSDVTGIRQLESAGYDVSDMVVYRSVRPWHSDDSFKERFSPLLDADVVIVTSSLACKNLSEALIDAGLSALFSTQQLVVIGLPTYNTAQLHGWMHIYQAIYPDDPSLVEQTLIAVASKNAAKV